MLCFICFIAFSLCSEIEIVMMPIDFKCFIALVKVQLEPLEPLESIRVDVLINILVVCRVRLSANRIVVTPEVGCKQSFKNLFVYLIKTDQSVHVLLSHHLSLSSNQRHCLCLSSVSH